MISDPPSVTGASKLTETSVELRGTASTPTGGPGTFITAEDAKVSLRARGAIIVHNTKMFGMLQNLSLLVKK